MNIRSCLDAIAAVQGGLAIEDPIAAKVKQVFRLPPARGFVLNSFPCFVNTVELLPFSYGSGLLRRTYVVNMQMFVKDANFNRACDIALAFEEEMIRAFGLDGNISLGGACTNIEKIEGSLGLLERGNDSYPGLDYKMTLHMVEGR